MTHLIVPLVGAFYRPPAKAVLGLLPSGTTLELRPEPDNEHDPDAIQVFVQPSVFSPDDIKMLDLHCQGYGADLDMLLSSPIHLGYIARTSIKCSVGNAQVLPVLKHKPETTLGFSAEGKPTVILTWSAS